MALFLCCGMIVGALSACAQTQSASAPAPEAAETENTADTAEEADQKEELTVEAAPEETEQVTISLFHQKQEAQETFAGIIDAFQKEYPYITVTQEIVTNDPSSVLKSRIATDEIPDIFQGALDTMDIAEGGYIHELTGLDFLDNINEEALASSSFTDSAGHTWAMPVDGSAEGILYNKDIFSELGLTPPETLEELDDVIEVLRDHDITPFALGFKDSWTIKPVTLIAAAPAVYAHDAERDAKKTAGETSFADTQAWTTTFELLQKVYESGNTSTAFDTDYNGACAMLAEGEAAMMIQGLWALEPVKSINPDANIGMMAMPVSDDPADAKLFQFPDFGLSISEGTEHMEECELFLAFLTRPEIAEMWSNNAKLFSAVKGVSVSFDPMAEDVNAYISSNMVCTQADRGWPTAFQPEYESALSAFLVDGISIEDTLSTLDTAWDNAVSATN